LSDKLKETLKEYVKMDARVFKPMLMKRLFLNHFRRTSGAVMLLLAGLVCQPQVKANPTGGTVAQGAATIMAAGSQVTINQSSANAFINWQSFNIGIGQTTTFVQPSASSVTWNYISDPSASSINGNINANGYVVLQNPNGFTIGGAATISAHGLVMTTAATPALDLSSGGAWTFSAPPPTAKIINYGQINIAGGGSAYLIASDIENDGTISAPGGKIGLYAGQQVLVSMSPDGRSLSAQVTLPEGSVDNQGQLIADAGSIVAQAQVVNQNGLVQANSVQNVNGTIELVASDAVNLGATSVISAQGGSQGSSAGGAVTIKSDTSFSDQAGSTINIAGGAQGGNGGQVSICAPQMNSIQSIINGQAAVGFLGGTLTVDPANIWLSSSSTDPNAPAGYTVIDVNSYSGLSLINLLADNNIELSTVWNLANQATAANLSLTAGNNITLDDGTAVIAGNNWNVSLTAGTQVTEKSQVTAGNGGIYLNGSAYLQTQNGNLTISAANEVLVQSGAIRTVGGGNIDVTTQYGDVNCGDNVNGFLFGSRKAPYYTVNLANLGGISTAAGGNVTITAGGNVISYLPVQSDYANAQHDAGTGAFGSQSGNVTITAGGNVIGHYVLANGVGTITAGGNIGAPLTDPNPQDGFALSLITGGWSIYAPNGSIYVQEVRNPNGIFGERPGSSPVNYAGYHVFNYDPNASVLFDAGNSVEITGNDAPDSPPSAGGLTIPILFPPSLTVITGSGDFILDTSVILFSSPNQNLNLNIGGNFIGVPNGNPINLEMSDSAAVQWVDDTATFGTGDHAASPPELNNPNPVEISVAGNMDYVNLYTTEVTHITVGGNMDNSGFQGENLHASDVTSINVTGKIYNSPIYTFASLSGNPIVSANPQQPGLWDSVFDLAVDPSLVAALTSFDATKNNPQVAANGLAYYLKQNNYLLFPSSESSGSQYGINPGFIYDPSSKQLGFKGNMSGVLTASQIAALEGGTFTVIVANTQGIPILDANGHIQVITYSFAGAAAIASLDTESQNSTLTQGLGFLIGGPGQFNITAASLDLGYSPGILSYGFGGNYSSLEGVSGTLASGGAAINVMVGGDINLITSAIASLDGGNVNVNAGGQMDLSQGSFDFGTSDCYGIYTTGHSDVSVTAGGDINVGSGCIATFNGGNVFVESYTGSVDAGSGANKALLVDGAYLDANGQPGFTEYGNLTDVTSLKVDPAPYGSGILAEYPTLKYQTPGGSGQPGNITVLTPKGNIVSSRGGISQFALDGSIAGGPIVTLIAGTTGVAATPDQGNIILGDGGVVGGTVNLTAQGNIQGLIVSRQNANLSAQQNIGITLLSGGNANVSSGGSTSGTIVGIGSVNVAGGGGVTAALLGQNVSVGGGAAISTLGTSSGATASSQAAAQQSSQADTQQVASGNSEDENKNKKKPAIRKVSRVTVLLSSAVPTQ
jgi:filamentous hemagglutinin family protein